MMLFDKIQAIINSYDLKPLKFPAGYNDIYSYLRSFPEKKGNYVTNLNDIYLINKYSDYIPQGHYGFSIGTPIIPVWNEIIDKILEICIENDPNFKIHQIKLKFGRICFYVYSELIEDIHDIEILISKTLYDPKLIY